MNRTDKKTRYLPRCALVFLALIYAAVPAHAEHVRGDLRDFISDLYGGGGIFLPPAPDIPTFIADAHVPHFTGEAQIEQLNALSNGILAGSGVFALNSTVTGVTFDLSQGVPVAVEDSLGPLLAERATTIGKGRLNFAFGYSNQDFSELDGEDLNSIQIALSHQDCCAVGPPPIPPPDGARTGFEEDTIILDIDINLEQEVYAFFGNYGVSDRWDVGLVVPLVSVDATAFSQATVFLANPGAGSTIGGEPVHSFELAPEDALSDTGGDKFGLGDIIVRSKYNFLRDSEGFMDLSVLGQITLPTGDEDDLLGTGETKYRAMLIASKNLGRITPHINLAYELTSGDDELDNFSYAVGFDARLSERFTVAADILGRHNPDLDFIDNNVIDLAFAVKWNPFSRLNAPLNAFVSIPLNDDGLRADVIYGVGIEYTLN